jgi:predicted membrane protein
VVQVFGGTKIIVPANWTVHSEMVAIFGGIEDKRPPQLNVAAEKVLVIVGTSLFGGIDIKSF